MKVSSDAYSTNTCRAINEEGSKVKEIAVEVVKYLTGKSLNHRQALAVLEIAQAEVKECMGDSKLEY
jgi:predicted XRE-type DNA-binding protein